MDGRTDPPLPSPTTWRHRVRKAAGVSEGLVTVAAALVIGACLAVLAVLIFDPERGEQWTSGLRPVQFYRELDADLLDDYAEVFAVAHNSGDRVESTLEAIGYGAEVIEVDVVSLDGQLYAAHDVPLRWVGETVFRGPPLARIWVASAGAAAVKLDLKESSPAFQELVLQFLADRRGQRRVMVVSDDPAALRRFADREPAVLRFFSPGNGDRLGLLDDDQAFAAIVDGVSLHYSLIDAELVASLAERNILTLAWTINDIGRVNELVQMGVAAITTDNLAIVKLLGDRQQGARRLDLLRAPPPPLDEPIPLPGDEPAAAVSAATSRQPDRAQTRGRPRPATPTPDAHRPPRRSTAARRARSWRRRKASTQPSRQR
jgi:glycerophosphoryl diester phosphodiesterase